MHNLLKLKSKQKAQFFVLSGFIIVTIFFAVSQLIQTATLDTSSTIIPNEIFIFNNIKENSLEVIKLSENCYEVEKNLKEYEIFIKEFTIKRNLLLKFDYIIDYPCKDYERKINFNLNLLSTTTNIKSDYIGNNLGLVLPTKYFIRTPEDLDNIRNDLNGNYTLLNDLYLNYDNWEPIGTEENKFKGTFDGNGYKIINVTINNINIGSSIGLFGWNDGIIKNIGLEDVSINGIINGGGITGQNSGNIENSYVVGSVIGFKDIGGLVGKNIGKITNSYSIINNSDNIILEGISTAEEFYNIRNDLNGNYVLKNDIDLSSYSNWNPIGTSEINPFKGTLNGNGYKITGLKINKRTTPYVGLFGINDGLIINIGIEDFDIGGFYYVGTLVGWNLGKIQNSYSTNGTIDGVLVIGGLVGLNGNGVYTEIENCWSSTNVIGNSLVGGLVGSNGENGKIINSYSSSLISGLSNVGGLVGYTFGSNEIENSVSIGSVNGDDSIGGLLGYMSQGIITNSYSISSISGRSYVGGLVGQISNGVTIKNSYSIGEVLGTNENNVGGLIGGKNIYGSGVVTVTNSYWNTETSGQSTSIYGIGKTIEELQVLKTSSNLYQNWDDSIWAFSTTDYPQIPVIFTGFIFTKLVGINFNGNITDSYWDTQLLTQSLILDPTAKKTIELKSLKNSSNLYSNWDSFRWEFSDLDYPKLKIIYEFEGGDGTINNPYQISDADGLNYVRKELNFNYILMNDIDLSSYSNWDPIGNLENPFSGTLNGNGYRITNLIINKSTSNYYGIFGIISSNSKIKNIKLENVKILGTLNYVGGLVGLSYGNIYDVGVENININGNDYAGGLVGLNEGIIDNSYVNGTIMGNDNIGGLVGNNRGIIDNSYVNGTIMGNRVVGGLVGNNNGEIKNSLLKGTVSGTSTVGGLIGYNSQFVENSYSLGIVLGDFFVGGFVGHNNGNIENSYSITNTDGKHNLIGGLVGLNGGIVENSYAKGNLSGGGGGNGGLVGSNNGGTVENSYSIVSVITVLTGNTNTGGLVGYNDNNEQIINSYWNIETSGRSTSAGGIGKTTSELQVEQTTTNLYSNWDSEIWGFSTINYPIIIGRNFSGGNGTKLDPYQIETANELNKIRNYLDSYFILNNNINLSYYSNWNPLGTFTGTLNGNGYSITDLNIDTVEDNVGLFNILNDGAEIFNLNIEGNVSGGRSVGMIVGRNDGTIENCSVLGTLSGDEYVGGIGGYNEGFIKQCKNSASVSGNDGVGGISGRNRKGTIENSYSTGQISGTNDVGGLVGFAASGTIINSYSTGLVSGNNYVGGLVGDFGTKTYNSYWDIETSSQSTSVGGIGKTTSELQVEQTITNLYSNWDSDVWEFSTINYPILKNE